MKFAGYNNPFTEIADYYDALMSFVDYPAWINYIESILRLNSIAEKKIMDLACGTGVCMELWWQKRYEVCGLDRSMPMLNVCRRRFRQFGINDIPLINADMRMFALRSKFPILTCLYDSLNYNLDRDDLMECMKNINDCLTPDGIFIFDMNTIHCLRDEWGNNVYERNDEAINSIWRNTYNNEANISSLKITLNIKRNGKRLVLREHHCERGYSLAEITDCLNESGFRVELYRHLTFNPAQESDLRIMGVAKKNADR
jgi:ubiquinone/menaquinone biosynthesis C-methylase UbiE